VASYLNEEEFFARRRKQDEEARREATKVAALGHCVEHRGEDDEVLRRESAAKKRTGKGATLSGSSYIFIYAVA
jgi:hypothetical protein